MDTTSLTEIKERLFDAFRDDHAVLGRALYELAEQVRSADASTARETARRLDERSGAHIGFEERNFYPALADVLSPDEIRELYADHASGQALLRTLVALPDDALEVPARRGRLLHEIEAMEAHVSECGELFGAMGGLDRDALARLLSHLEDWRERAPRWTEL